MATEDDFAHIWYADGNGNVTGYVVNGGDIASTIIDAYNEHFGTDISIWTPEKNTLQVGATVPNWNAYEKIEIPSQKVAFSIQKPTPVYIFGEVKNNILQLNTDENEDSWLATDEGVISSKSSQWKSGKEWIIQQIGEHGITLTDIVANIVQYEVGQNISDWSQYEKIV